MLRASSLSVIVFFSAGAEEVLRLLMLVMLSEGLEQVLVLSLKETTFLDDFCAFLGATEGYFSK